MQPPRRIVAAVTALHALVGAWIAASITGPLLAIDDLAYLSMGRTLAGGGASPLPAQPPYGVLYPSLLAPGWLVGLDESQMIVFAQVINALLGAALLPVLYALVRRLTNASCGRALVAASIGASLPAALLTGSIVWTERLLPLLVALALLLLLRLVDRPSLARVASVAIVAAALYAAHPRTIVVAIVVVASGMWVLAGTRDRALLAVLWALGHVGIALAELARRGLARSTFGEGATYDGADLASRRGVDDLPDMALHAAGTVAYLVLATAGLAVLGFIVLVRRAQAAAIYSAMLVGTVAVAGWFLAGIGRADSYLHGRYIEVLAPLLVALGVIGARRFPWRLSASVMAVAVVVSGLYGAWAGPGNNWSHPRTPVMMLGTEMSGAPFGANVFEPGAAAGVALAASVLLLVAARARTWLLALTASALIALAVMSGTQAIDSLRDNSTVGEVQAALTDVTVDRVAISDQRVPSTIAGAVAWEVGFDKTTAEISGGVTHVLLPSDAASPSGAVAVAEIGVSTDADGVRSGGAVLWELG